MNTRWLATLSSNKNPLTQGEHESDERLSVILDYECRTLLFINDIFCCLNPWTENGLERQKWEAFADIPLWSPISCYLGIPLGHSKKAWVLFKWPWLVPCLLIVQRTTRPILSDASYNSHVQLFVRSNIFVNQTMNFFILRYSIRFLLPPSLPVEHYLVYSLLTCWA